MLVIVHLLLLLLPPNPTLSISLPAGRRIITTSDREPEQVENLEQPQARKTVLPAPAL